MTTLLNSPAASISTNTQSDLTAPSASPQYTSATVPAANTVSAGTEINTTDLGYAVSNGTSWIYGAFQNANGPARVIAQWGIPVGIAGSGSIANNGALTLTTALAAIRSDIFLYFPAGAIAAGSLAGFYYCQMSSTTVGVIFNNTYTSGVPAIPSPTVAFTTTGPGAYTQTTGALAGLTFTLPANSLGINGRLHWRVLGSNNNSAGTKNFLGQLGGATVHNPQATTNQAMFIDHDLLNAGKTGAQINQAAGQVGPGVFATAPNSAMAVDTTTALTIALSFNNNTAADWALYEHGSIVVYPS